MEKTHLSKSTYFQIYNSPLPIQFNRTQRFYPSNIQIDSRAAIHQIKHINKQLDNCKQNFRFSANALNKSRTTAKLCFDNFDYQVNQTGPLTQRIQNKIHQSRVPKFLAKNKEQLQYTKQTDYILSEGQHNSYQGYKHNRGVIGSLQKKNYQKEKSIKSTQSPKKLQQFSPRILKDQQNQLHTQVQVLYSKYNQIFKENQVLKSERRMLQSKVQSIERFHEEEINALRRRIKILEETTDDIRQFMMSQMI